MLNGTLFFYCAKICALCRGVHLGDICRKKKIVRFLFKHNNSKVYRCDAADIILHKYYRARIFLMVRNAFFFANQMTRNVIGTNVGNCELFYNWPLA